MAYTGSAEPAELLAAWESGLARGGPGRAQALHAVARPGTAGEELRSVPVGERERDLHALRRALFGDRMQVVADCAACGEVVEFELDARALALPAPRLEEPLRVAADGWTLDFRLPTVADLEWAAATAAAAASGAAPGTGEARRALVARCTVAAARDGAPVPAAQLAELLPEQVLQQVAAAAEAADPAAEVVLRVGCPECGERTPAVLDIADHLWAELDSWARDVLLDVHLLASAYGWSERDILALSPLRRRYYLELCADV